MAPEEELGREQRAALAGSRGRPAVSRDEARPEEVPAAVEVDQASVTECRGRAAACRAVRPERVGQEPEALAELPADPLLAKEPLDQELDFRAVRRADQRAAIRVLRLAGQGLAPQVALAVSVRTLEELV